MIRKSVGKMKDENPLQRAFRLKQMLEELRGERLEDDENVRRVVGRLKPKKN
jgi:hypothetical protein